MKKSLPLTTLSLIALISCAHLNTPAKPNSEMKTVLNELESKHPLPIETLTAEQARLQPTPADAVKEVLKNEQKSSAPEIVARVQDRYVMGSDGLIPARFYYPEGNRPMPVIVYYHGGGWVIATNDTYDATPRALANKAHAIVVSIEYRKAPEHKFPAAHNDAYAAYKWILTNASSFGGDASNVAVAGESAGGNLAVNVSIRARDEGIKIPVHQLVVYPVASGDMNSESYKQNATAKPLNKPMMEWFSLNYLNSPDEANDPRINLVDADLNGLPSTTLITAQIDPLRTDGQKLAKKLEEAGVEVDYKNYDGVTHEFFGMAPVVNEAREAQEMAARNLKESFEI